MSSNIKIEKKINSEISNSIIIDEQKTYNSLSFHAKFNLIYLGILKLCVEYLKN